MTFQLRLRNNKLITLPRPAVMGVVNASPNSFYNPCKTLDAALKTVEKMVAEGADIIDVGGEATNPKVKIDDERPSEDEELHRVLPVIEAIRQRFPVLISIDTRRARVMFEAIHLGADIINDQRALNEENALETAVKLHVPVCLMHYFETARAPHSSSKAELMTMIKNDLKQRILTCEKAGITRDRIIIDPGFGGGNYSKNTAENFYLLTHLQEFIDLKFPVLVGWSRKSMIGEALGGRAFEDRLFGSVAADTLATYFGAHILRVHDVKAASDAAKVAKLAKLTHELCSSECSS